MNSPAEICGHVSFQNIVKLLCIPVWSAYQAKGCLHNVQDLISHADAYAMRLL